MSARRQDFLARFDWIRTGLMFEPRGHDMMSGGFLYPVTQPDCDCGILFIETSGCLPMCGHGTIGMVTFGIENGLITPREPREAARPKCLAGIIWILPTRNPATASHPCASAMCRAMSPRKVSRSTCRILGGSKSMSPMAAIIMRSFGAAEGAYAGLDALGAARIPGTSSPVVRRLDAHEKIEPVHPLDPTIRGVSHVLWADKPKGEGADGRNAVFYGERAIDRSPCGTGTSARLAHLAHHGKLKPGDRFVHESYIGSRFIGRVEEAVTLGNFPAIIPSIEGSAIATGYNQIWIDEEDPFWRGSPGGVRGTHSSSALPFVAHFVRATSPQTGEESH